MSKMDMHIGRGLTGTTIRPAETGPGGGTIKLRDFVMPLAIIGASLILVLALAVDTAVRAFDHGQMQREHILARNGIEKRIVETARMVVPQTDRDDAIANLDHQFDADWSRNNFGSFLNQADGFGRAFVLGGDDRLIAAYVDGVPAPAAAYAPLEPAVAGLIATVRAQEATRGPFHVVAHDRMISRPIQASAFKLVGEELAVTTATLVQPDFGNALPRGRQAPIVVTTMAVDTTFLEVFSHRYLLENLHLLPAGKAPNADETAIAARDETGRALAQFVWKPLAPGYSLLHDMIVPIVLFALLLIAAAALQLRQISRLARALIDREAFWRELASCEVTTGLLNRPAFMDQLAFELDCLGEVSGTLAVLVIEIGFAPAGEAGRDERIGSIVADRLKHICREGAVMARLGDDSFGILAVGAGGPGGQAMRGRVHAALARPISIEGLEIAINVHVGVAIAGDKTAEAGAVMEQARADAHR